MNRKDILEALNEISDAHIEKTAQPPRKRVSGWYWYSGIAAVLAVAILLGIFLPGKEPPISIENPSVPSFGNEPAPTQPQQPTENHFPSVDYPGVPMPTQAHSPTLNNTLPAAKPTVSPTRPAVPTMSTKPTVVQKPTLSNTVPITKPTVSFRPPQSAKPTTAATEPTVSTKPTVSQKLAESIVQAQYPEESDYVGPSKHVAGLGHYFPRTMAQFLQDDQGNDNVAFSPINLYMALAMLAETTDGQTRAEIISLLGARDINDLREQAKALWYKSYRTGDNPCILGNSVWLQKGISYNQDTMNTLAAEYFASVYGVDFSTPGAGHAVAEWIDNETAGMLKEHTQALEFDPSTVMALASTVYMQADWETPFKEESNTQDVFNGTKGQTTCTFMHQSFIRGYYCGEGYSAVRVKLNGNHAMWFLLPEEGKTTDDLLRSEWYLELFIGGNVNDKKVVVNLSMPKFDIDCKQDMIAGLQNLGIKQVFQTGQADFTPSFPEMANELSVGMVEQATRVTVDEEGVAAAGYVVVGKPGSSMIPTEEVDFVLDRPFLFFITNSADLPIFAGVVNNP